MKFTAAAGAAPLVRCASKPIDKAVAEESAAILVDLTQCAGCRECEVACAAANDLPAPQIDWDTVDDVRREPSDTQFQVVNRFETSAGDVFVRKQCMHCLEPACAAACLTKALYKTEQGPVIWRADKCMGCRYCMVSCPFDAPKFEYGSAVPKIMKCKMCFERVAEGNRPACVENCPAEALVFGKRSELLEIARQRIYQNPGKYVSHIYGEHEAGGTSWLYISSVPFEELGFPATVGEEPYPEKTRNFLTSVPFVLALWPVFMLGLRQARLHAQKDESHSGSEREG